MTENQNSNQVSFEVLGLDLEAKAKAEQRMATRAKPPGSLGRIEDIAIQLSAVTGKSPAAIPEKPAVAVFAADHGVVSDGASRWPSEVTQFMFMTMAQNAAAINAFSKVAGASMALVDIGINADMQSVFSSPELSRATRLEDLGASPNEISLVLDKKVRFATASIAREDAMSVDQANQAVQLGADVAKALVANGSDLLAGGEMGIGNTTVSAALIAAVTQSRPEDVVGYGAGEPEAGISHKRDLVEVALQRATSSCGIGLLSQIGGLEIAALAGFYCQAAEMRVPFIADGVISVAALCISDLIAPGTAQYAIAGHLSIEPGATVALNYLGLKPLLDLGLRLGEGTGAMLAINLVKAAAQAMNSMADLPAM